MLHKNATAVVAALFSVHVHCDNLNSIIAASVKSMSFVSLTRSIGDCASMNVHRLLRRARRIIGLITADRFLVFDNDLLPSELT
ncbi:hypothetical protein CPB83DRAFT_853759 [Crepidotus variabilis]|uniref:Uncharacterized protein n=1 Tax=Crepidotus variabilis TaxID=179855 RepID=A0A9P6JQJ2_9AGAR|nr:hypothetical protein CPB83DRAFT_853759 [Crepidotus variabilis]